MVQDARGNAALPWLHVEDAEWGFQADVPGKNGTVVSGTASDYGDPFRDFLESRKISWTAWCASYDGSTTARPRFAHPGRAA
jgi:hypothetical protein